MKNLLLTLVSSALIAIGSSAAFAQDVFYECDLTDRDPRVDWVSPKYAFVVQEKGVSVIDNIILMFNEQPIVTRKRARADGFRVNWNVQVEDSLNNRVRMSYRAVLNTADNSVTVRAAPVGAPQSWNGSGTCKIRKQ